MILEILAELIICCPFLVLGFLGIYILMISYVFITAMWQYFKENCIEKK